VFAIIEGYFARPAEIFQEIDGRPNYQLGAIQLASVPAVLWGLAGFLVGLWPALDLPGRRSTSTCRGSTSADCARSTPRPSDQ